MSQKFKIVFDSVRKEYTVFVEVPFLFFWKVWQPVNKHEDGIVVEREFKSYNEALDGIDLYKKKKSIGYQRYVTTEVER